MWGDIVILICISLTIGDIKHLFICLLAISTLPLKKCLFRSFAHFLIGLLLDFFVWGFFGVEICKFIIYFGFHLLSDGLTNMLPHSMGFLFIILMVYFAEQKIFSLIQSHLFIFSFVYLVLGDISDKILLWAMSEISLPIFSFWIFIVSGLIFNSLMHFKFILVYGHHKQINKQLLARLWGKQISALLVGSQTGEATVENSMEFPQKIKNGTAFCPRNSTAGIIP